MIYSTLNALINKTGSKLSPEEFQEIINVTFHDIEANYYDSIHEDMWESLQEQIDLLIEDICHSGRFNSKNLRLLDIGCGTGLGTQILLNSKIGDLIDYITLLDTSKNMLKEAEKKAITWNRKYALVNSQVSCLTEEYDIVLICSVLHHIPDLKCFLESVDAVLKSGGILIHLHDPNADYRFDSEYLERVEEYKKDKLISTKRKVTHFIPSQWKDMLKRQFGRKTYIDLVNDKLIADKVIKRRMTADEIWSVTDIQVENKQNKEHLGISLGYLRKQLMGYELISQRSYGFYGPLTQLAAFSIKIEKISQKCRFFRGKEGGIFYSYRVSA